MSNMLIHIADRVLNRPLLILPDKLALIASILEGRIAGASVGGDVQETGRVLSA